MIDKTVLKNKKSRISLLRKTRSALLSEACSILAEAKTVHDNMEALYNPYINFEELYEYADKLVEDILQNSAS